MSEKLPFDSSHEPWNNGEGGPLICGRCGAESGSPKGSERCEVELAGVMARVAAQPLSPTLMPAEMESTTAISRKLILGSAAAMLAEVVRTVEHWLICAAHDSHEDISVSSMTLDGEAEMSRVKESATRALAVYEAAREGLGWQPIETAPKDGTKIIGYENGQVSMVWWDPSGWDDGGYSPGFRPAPTHWMPMPEPPK